MRKVTEQTVRAFINGQKKTIGNTTVTVNERDTALSLHGSVIAMRDNKTGVVMINNHGYTTNTTKERLNGLIETLTSPSQKVYQQDFNWYWTLNGKKTEFPCDEWVTL